MAARITRGAGASVLYRMLQKPSNKPWAGDSLNSGPPAATANQRSAAAPLAVRAMKMPTARLNLPFAPGTCYQCNLCPSCHCGTTPERGSGTQKNEHALRPG